MTPGTKFINLKIVEPSQNNTSNLLTVVDCTKVRIRASTNKRMNVCVRIYKEMSEI